MQPESRAFLWDAHRAAVLIATFVDGKQWADYADDAMLRSAVERQFEIVGERSTASPESIQSSPRRLTIYPGSSPSATC